MKTTHTILSIIAFIIVGFCIFVIINRSRRSSGNYDERQKVARGTAFKYAFIAMIAYFVISEVSCILLGRDWATHETNLSLGLCFSIFVFAVVCIVKDAYLSFKQKVADVCIPLLALGIINILLSFVNGRKPVRFTDNMLDVSVNFVCGITVALIGIIVLTKNLLERRLDSAR